MSHGIIQRWNLSFLNFKTTWIVHWLNPELIWVLKELIESFLFNIIYVNILIVLAILV